MSRCHLVSVLHTMNEIRVSKTSYNALTPVRKTGEWNLLMCPRIVLGGEPALHTPGREVAGLE